MNRIPPLVGATVGFVVGLLMACQQYEASILLITAIILAVTLHHVVRYADAARRQAEILKDQFDVQYRPHLRPDVLEQNDSYICIRLRNLSGAAAIHPGVYPEWTRPHERCGDLLPVKMLLNPTSFPPQDDFATCPVLAVEDEKGWWVRKPGHGESMEIKVQWGEPPWEIRHEHIWPLEPNPDPGKKGELHFVPGGD